MYRSKQDARMTEVDTTPAEAKDAAPLVETAISAIADTQTKATEAAPPATEGESAAKDGEQEQQLTPEEKAKEAERAEKRGRFQKHIDDLTRKTHYWQDRALRAEQVREQAQKELPPLKDRYEYQTEAEYEQAREQRDDARQTARESGREAQIAAEEAAHAENEIWREKINSERDEYPDFEAVAYKPDVPYSDVMVAAVRGHTQGVGIAYYLGKNPDKAKEIAAMPPLDAALAIGEIAAELRGRQKSQPSQPASKRGPSAPPPPPTLSGKASGAGKVNLYRANTEDYFEARMKQINGK